MEWLEGVNQALEYIEEHLDDEINYDEISKKACLSKTGLQKLFLFATSMTLTEYIRKRRLSMAAIELSKGEKKVIDIALKYGYESPSSFTRAFQNLFKKKPTQIRNSEDFSPFPPIHLSLKIDKGEMIMNERPIVKIEEHGKERVVSFKVDCHRPETIAWQMLSKWCVDHLVDYTARRFIGFAPNGHHPDGSSPDSSDDDIKHEYLAQVLLYGDEGLDGEFLGEKVSEAPKGLFLVSDVVLNQFDENGHLDIGSSMMKSSEVFQDFINNIEGYAFDFNGRTFCEEHIFSDEWFETGGPPKGFKLWMPIKRV